MLLTMLFARIPQQGSPILSIWLACPLGQIRGDALCHKLIDSNWPLATFCLVHSSFLRGLSSGRVSRLTRAKRPAGLESECCTRTTPYRPNLFRERVHLVRSLWPAKHLPPLSLGGNATLIDLVGYLLARLTDQSPGSRAQHFVRRRRDQLVAIEHQLISNARSIPAHSPTLFTSVTTIDSNKLVR